MAILHDWWTWAGQAVGVWGQQGTTVGTGGVTLNGQIKAIPGYELRKKYREYRVIMYLCLSYRKNVNV